MSGAPRILIVDDEEALLESLGRAACASGFDARTARDGSEAWDLLRGQRFDVVVTDLRMPGVDGPELMARMEREGLATAVVVITGFATLEAAVDCLRKGAVDFLVKPFEVDAFLKSLERALARPGANSSAEPDWDRIARRYRLTRRQKEILRAICATGKSSRELAEGMCLSPHTVRSHLKAAYLKMGVSSRTQLLQRIRQSH